MTTEINLVIPAGEDYEHEFTVYEDDGVTPRDLTYDLIDASFREGDATNKRTLFNLRLTDGIEIIDPEAGRFRMTIIRSITEGLRFREDTIEGVWDMEITDPAMLRKRAAQGTFVISLDVTRFNNNGM